MLMNYKTLKDKKHNDYVKSENKKYSKKMTMLDPSEYAHIQAMVKPDQVWRSCDYAVQVFFTRPVRISINRSLLNNDSNWMDGITWDELQRIKNECGFEHHCFMELYPPKKHVVNVANIRHLWAINDPEFMWK